MTRKNKIKVSFIAVVAATSIALFLSRSVVNRSHAQVAAVTEKSVEQTHKNIQVLKGMPDSQLTPAMNFMRASLGVSCAHCHVNSGEDKWEFEKDDKPAKLTARKHIQLTLDLNKNHFGGQTVVTCNTCHQGQRQPNALPLLPQKPPEGGAAGVIAAVALPSVEQVLDKYVAALGGRPAVEKVRTRIMKGSQISWNGTVIPVEIYQSAPNRFLSVLTMPRGPAMQGYNGKSGWLKNPRGQRELNAAELAEIKLASDLNENLKLKDIYPNLMSVAKERIGDREVVVLESKNSTSKIERFFFDTQTGLLLRRITLVQTMLGQIPEQIDFEDYRDVDGTKVPFTVRQSFVDPWSGWTRKFTEIKHNLPIDDAKFDLPATAKPSQ